MWVNKLIFVEHETDEDLEEFVLSDTNWVEMAFTYLPSDGAQVILGGLSYRVTEKCYNFDEREIVVFLTRIEE